MFKLFNQGGPLFMGLLSILLLFVLVAFVYSLSKANKQNEIIKKGIEHVKSISTLALVIGILGQLIGLYSAFSAMELTEGISNQILVGGLKISMITTLYGLVIFIIGQLAAIFLRSKLS